MVLSVQVNMHLLTGSVAATQHHDAASQPVLDRQHRGSPEWQLTGAFLACLSTPLLAAAADLEEVEVDGFVFRRKRSVSAATTSQRGRNSEVLQASSKRRRTSTAGAVSGGWVAERLHQKAHLRGGGGTTVRASCEILQTAKRLSAVPSALMSTVPGSSIRVPWQPSLQVALAAHCQGKAALGSMVGRQLQHNGMST